MHSFIHMKSFSNHINFIALSRSWCNKCYKWQINIKIYNTPTYVIWVLFASFCQICHDARIFKPNLWLVGSTTASQSDVMLGNPCYLTWISTWIFFRTTGPRISLMLKSMWCLARLRCCRCIWHHQEEKIKVFHYALFLSIYHSKENHAKSCSTTRINLVCPGPPFINMN